MPIELVPNDPGWSAIACAEIGRLKEALGDLIVEAHHIGSTAIPGIRAKPIVDLMPVVSNLSGLDADADKVVALGYEWRGEYGIAGRRYCPLSDPQTGKRLFHVHFFVQGGSEIRRHLAFRDYLRRHAGEARAYEAQKLAAAALHPDDGTAYTDAKAPWIKDCLVRALAWADRQG
jgi:GrpB-like predicted nucleotidyltransferase (UPF0157 family)